MKTKSESHATLVKDYFETVAKLFSGDRSALSRMMSLWTADGTLSVVAVRDSDGWDRSRTYEGTEAIRARYEAMLNPKAKLASVDHNIGVTVTFTVQETRLQANTVTAAVIASMRTNEKTTREFKVDRMKFVFTLDENGKIQKSLENVDWSGAVASYNIASVEGSLKIQDIGRLTLAAWAIA